MIKKMVVSFQMDTKAAWQARVVAAMRNESRSELIRRAIVNEVQRLQAQSATQSQEVQTDGR